MQQHGKNHVLAQLLVCMSCPAINRMPWPSEGTAYKHTMQLTSLFLKQKVKKGLWGVL
jgi:hypothetical protein